MFVMIAPALSTTLGFTFSPGGHLFPYYVGAAYTLKDAGLLTPRTPLGGSSAGSVVATCLACDLDEQQVLFGLDNLVNDVRGGMLLQHAVQKHLDLMLPDDAAARCEAHGLHIAYLRVTPWPKRMLVTKWADKADLIDTICGSCNWPLFFSKYPLVWCRGSLALDGWFTEPNGRFGCPPVADKNGVPPHRTIGLCCVPKGYMPGSALEDFPLRDRIHPLVRDDGTIQTRQMRVSRDQWFSWCPTLATDDERAKLIAAGREHAQTWLSEEELCP